MVILFNFYIIKCNKIYFYVNLNVLSKIYEGNVCVDETGGSPLVCDFWIIKQNLLHRTFTILGNIFCNLSHNILLLTRRHGKMYIFTFTNNIIQETENRWDGSIVSSNYI